MKTRELIRLLNEADPSGELECCVGNVDILDVSVEPSYWDGTLQVLRRDPEKEPYYNIVSADFIRSDEVNKVVINTHSISDAIYENPELPVGYIGFGGEYYTKLERMVEETRESSRRVRQDVLCDSFTRWVKKKIAEEPEWRLGEADILEDTVLFARENLRDDDPIDADIHAIRKPWIGSDGKSYESSLSWDERRHLQWDRDYEVVNDGGALIIRRRS